MLLSNAEKIYKKIHKFDDTHLFEYSVLFRYLDDENAFKVIDVLESYGIELRTLSDIKLCFYNETDIKSRLELMETYDNENKNNNFRMSIFKTPRNLLYIDELVKNKSIDKDVSEIDEVKQMVQKAKGNFEKNLDSALSNGENYSFKVQLNSDQVKLFHDVITFMQSILGRYKDIIGEFDNSWSDVVSMLISHGYNDVKFIVEQTLEKMISPENNETKELILRDISEYYNRIAKKEIGTKIKLDSDQLNLSNNIYSIIDSIPSPTKEKLTPYFQNLYSAILSLVSNGLNDIEHILMTAIRSSVPDFDVNDYKNLSDAIYSYNLNTKSRGV